MSDLTLYYAPRTRSFTALWMLEELGADYTLESFDLLSGRHKTPEFLALNPMGKVPLVVDRGCAVSETGAIAIYLADVHRAADLAPPVDHPDRPAYLRWMFFAGAIMEPAFGEKFFKWDVPAQSVAWGSFAQMLATLESAVTAGPWLFGERFSMADVVVGAGARFGVMFGVIPKDGVVGAYVERLTARPAFKRANAIEQAQGERFPPSA